MSKRWTFVKKTGAPPPAALWTPSDLATAPQFWFDADAITGLSNGDQLNTWTNLGSEGNGVRDSTNSVTDFPKYVTSSLNGLPGVEWNLRSAGQGTRFQCGAIASGTRTNDITALAVWKTSTVASGACRVFTSESYFELALNRTAARANVAWWNGSFATTVASSPTITTTAAFMTTGVWDRTAATRTIWVNGSQEAHTTSLGSSTFTGLQEVIIGNNVYGPPSLGQQFQGTMHELIMLTSTYSSSDREKLEGYLAWKWGLEGDLPGGHPYKSAAPTNP
jgi:hypothetical protein